MQLVSLARPVPGQGPADVVRTFAFLSNLMAQEATGDRRASVTVDRVLTRLAGSEDSDAILLALIDEPVLAPVGPLGLPQLPSSGDDRSFDVAAFAYLSVPLLEERRVLEVELVYDVTYLPLPGEELASEGAEVQAELLAGVEKYAKFLDRDILQLWSDRPVPGFERAVTVTQWVLDRPTPLSPHRPVQLVENYALSGRTALEVAGLLTVASADANYDGLYTETATWDPQRLQQAAARQRHRGERNLLALLKDEDGRVHALAEFTGHAEADTTIAELGVVAVRRDARGNGLGSAVLAAGIASLDPEITRLYASAATTDAATARLLAPYRPETLASTTCWQRTLGGASIRR